MELPLPRVDELEEKLKLRVRAAAAGSSGVIRSGDTAFDDGQQSIVYGMGDILARGRTIAVRNLDQYQKERGEIAAKLQDYPLQTFPKAIDAAVNIVLRKHEPEFTNTQRTEVQSRRNLRAYRLRNNIDRPPRYPKWGVWHWAIVLTIFFVESIANSQFFAKASPFGLVGGWLQAAVISAINIGFALLGGMVVLPWRHQRQASRQSTTIPSTVASMTGFLILLFNFAAAHYRVLLEEMPEQAIKLAINHLISSPFAVDNFDAWVLLFAGLIFATVAWIEGYKSDDPLREYGRLARNYEVARTENAAKKSAIRAEAVSKFVEKKKELRTAARESKMLLNENQTLITRSKSEADEYRAWRERVEDATRTLLSRYRNFYLEVDEELDPKPAYFTQDYTFPGDTPLTEETERLNQAEELLAEFGAIRDKLETIRDEAIDQEDKVIVALQRAVDEFFARIEGVAVEESNQTYSGPANSTPPVSASPEKDQ